VETLRKLARALGVRLRISFEEFGTLPDEFESFRRENLLRAPFEHDPVFNPTAMLDMGEDSDVVINGGLPIPPQAEDGVFVPVPPPANQAPWQERAGASGKVIEWPTPADQSTPSTPRGGKIGMKQLDAGGM
jgi:hypothetical protein